MKGIAPRISGPGGHLPRRRSPASEELEDRGDQQVPAAAYGMTFREMTVLHLVAAGKTDKEIAFELGISPLTVQKHLSHIFDKMGVSSRTEAGVRAVREGLVE